MDLTEMEKSIGNYVNKITWDNYDPESHETVVSIFNLSKEFDLLSKSEIMVVLQGLLKKGIATAITDDLGYFDRSKIRKYFNKINIA